MYSLNRIMVLLLQSDQSFYHLLCRSTFLHFNILYSGAELSGHRIKTVRAGNKDCDWKNLHYTCYFQRIYI